MIRENRDCEFTLDVLDDALDGRLESPDLGRLRAHLAGCDECAAKMDDARFVRGLFTAVEAPSCPDRVVDSILEAVDAPRRMPRTAAPTGRWLARSASWSWVGAAAAAIAVLAVLVPIHTTTSPPEAAPTVAEVADAARQLELAFSVMSREMTRATDILGEEISTQMSRSIRSGMNRAGKAFLPLEPKDDRQGQTSFPPDEHWLDTKPTWKG